MRPSRERRQTEVAGKEGLTIVDALAVAVLILAGVYVTTVTAARSHPNYISVRLHTVVNFGALGIINLQKLLRERATRFTVVAFGLQRGRQYLWLCYGSHTIMLRSRA